jgi:hypothetical protein
MKTEDEVELMIARIEGRIEANGEGYYENGIKLEALEWVVGEVDTL